MRPWRGRIRIGRRVPWLVLLAGVLLGCGTVPTSVPGPQVLPLDPYVGRLYTVQVALDGVPLRLLFDTGAGLTLLVPERAKQSGCVPRGRSVGWRMGGERVVFALCRGGALALGSLRAPLPVYGIFDLARVLPAELPPLDGVLGLDAFGSGVLVVRLAQRELAIEPAGAAVAPGWTEIPMRVASGIDGATRVVFLGARAADGGLYWLELDSGNLDAVLLAPHVTDALGLRADGRLTLDLGALRGIPVEARARELLHDGALNAAFLERYDIRLDFGSLRAWLRPAQAS
jgi:hypothetical protein